MTSTRQENPRNLHDLIAAADGSPGEISKELEADIINAIANERRWAFMNTDNLARLMASSAAYLLPHYLLHKVSLDDFGRVHVGIPGCYDWYQDWYTKTARHILEENKFISKAEKKRLFHLLDLVEAIDAMEAHGIKLKQENWGMADSCRDEAERLESSVEKLALDNAYNLCSYDHVERERAWADEASRMSGWHKLSFKKGEALINLAASLRSQLTQIDIKNPANSNTAQLLQTLNSAPALLARHRYSHSIIMDNIMAAIVGLGIFYGIALIWHKQKYGSFS